MANICDTQYKVTGSRKAVTDLWKTLQELEVNSKNVHLYLVAEHYGIDYEKKGFSVRGSIYWAEFEESVEDDYALLSFGTESAWSSCDLLFEEVNKALGILRFSSKEAAARVEKLLRSAIANWEQKNERKAESGELFITKIFVDGGATLKRMRPAPQGRGYRIRKRSNHVTLFVGSKSNNEDQN